MVFVNRWLGETFVEYFKVVLEKKMISKIETLDTFYFVCFATVLMLAISYCLADIRFCARFDFEANHSAYGAENSNA